MSDTPRTDALESEDWLDGGPSDRTDWVASEFFVRKAFNFARQLERELAAAQADLARSKNGECLKCGIGPSRETCAYPEACEHPGRVAALERNQALLSLARANAGALDAKDAARYRWLRNSAEDWSCCFAEKPKFDGGAWYRNGSRWVYGALDSAIDAAIAAAPAAPQEGSTQTGEVTLTLLPAEPAAGAPSIGIEKRGQGSNLEQREAFVNTDPPLSPDLVAALALLDRFAEASDKLVRHRLVDYKELHKLGDEHRALKAK